MLDAICLSQSLHVFVYEWGPIVVDRSLEDPEPCNDMFSNEVCYGRSSGFFKGMASIHFVKYFVAAKIHM